MTGPVTDPPRVPYAGLVRRALLLLLLAGCAPAPSGEPVSIAFRASVAGEPWACETTYDGMGLDGASYAALDLRLYVHDVRLVTSTGDEIPVVLTPDGAFQDDEVAMLDFETNCLGGTAATHEVILGRAEPADDVVAIRFRLGVPEHRNHLLAASQPAPLNQTALFWGWQAGYMFLNAVGRTEAGLSVFVLGAMDCTGDARMGTRTCTRGNRPEIELPVAGMEALTTGAVVLDVAQLYAGIDARTDGGGSIGCESLPTDPECAPMFDALGLSPVGEGTGVQRVFSFEAP